MAKNKTTKRKNKKQDAEIHKKLSPKKEKCEDLYKEKTPQQLQDTKSHKKLSQKQEKCEDSHKEKTPQQLGMEYENYVYKKLKADFPEYTILREAEIRNVYKTKPRAIDFSLQNDKHTIFIQCKFVKNKLQRNTLAYICETFRNLDPPNKKICIIDATHGATSGCEHVLKNNKNVYITDTTNIKCKRKQYEKLKYKIEELTKPCFFLSKIFGCFTG